jgi:hypothetical protein
MLVYNHFSLLLFLVFTPFIEQKKSVDHTNLFFLYVHFVQKKKKKKKHNYFKEGSGSSDLMIMSFEPELL